jgi:uncharacterized protein (DUF1330 family)
MTVYVVAQLSIHDRARYDRYAAGFLPVLSHYGGRLLASDESPETLDGAWERDKVVLLSFPDRCEALRWMNSEEYRSIAQDRQAATDGCALLVRGIESFGRSRHAVPTD